MFVLLIALYLFADTCAIILSFNAMSNQKVLKSCVLLFVFRYIGLFNLLFTIYYSSYIYLYILYSKNKIYSLVNIIEYLFKCIYFFFINSICVVYTTSLNNCSTIYKSDSIKTGRWRWNHIRNVLLIVEKRN